MATTASVDSPFATRDRSTVSIVGWAERRFFWATLTVAGGACFLAGWLPLGVSIVAVFLFAGPHNWMEARYLMSRMPARWGPLRPFYLTGLVGVPLLTASFAAMPWLGRLGQWNHEQWLTGLAAWNSLLIVWIVALVWQRSRQQPRRDWAWTMPAALALGGVNWLWPQGWDLALVFLHPLMALWFVDRELRTHRRSWRRPYRQCLAVLPLLILLLWWRLAGTADLPGDDALSTRIAAHAGAGVLTGISTHLLVSTHVFLEMLHYGVWLVMIPMISFSSAPWRLAQVPLARHSALWRRSLAALLLFGAAATVAIWAGFLSNYPLTRDIYFTVAMLHVLAEIPFLLRLL